MDIPVLMFKPGVSGNMAGHLVQQQQQTSSGAQSVQL
jgi:hypothetical protein